MDGRHEMSAPPRGAVVAAQRPETSPGIHSAARDELHPPARVRRRSEWDRLRTPATLARLVWLVGVISVISAAFPAFRGRGRLLAEIIPPVFPAAATTGTLAVGVVLMLLAGGL